MQSYKTGTLLIIFLYLHIAELYSQNTNTTPWEDTLEQLSMDAEGEGHSWESLMEDITDRLLEPLNLNTATRHQLEQFPFLNDIQIENLLAYVYIHGQMQTVYELQLVEEMDRATIVRLLPFVYVQPIKEKEKLPRFKELIRYGKHEVLTRFDIPFYKRKGYDKLYVGPPLYNSLRYGYRYKDKLYIGMTGEKDAGEPFLALHNKKGYDYYSFYFLLKDVGKLKALAIGNYRLSFGQGLVLSTDFLMGKTTTLSTISSRGNSIRKHSSTDEYNYFRGVATAFRLNDFVVSAFYSNRSLDGKVTDNAITSIQKTGLHRYKLEIDKINALTLQLAGGNITYSKKNLKVGATGIYYFFDKPYEPQLRNYSRYNLRGNNFYNIGLDYRYRLNRFTFSGETAIGKNKAIAALNMVTYNLQSNYHFTLLHRYYAHDYWAFFARSFSEAGYVQNENGWYLAAEATPVKNWKFFLSADFFSFPWLKYLVDKPSQGFDLQAQASYSPRKNLTMFLRYRYKQKEKNYTNEDGSKSVLPIYHQRARYQIKYSPVQSIGLRTTLDYNSVNFKNSSRKHGYQVVQTVSYKLPFAPLSLEVHGAYFHTDGYDARVYSYEKGLLYSFYIPSFYGEGLRFTGHVRCDIGRKVMLIGKIGQTRYFDREEIGTGNDRISGNKKTDLQLQLRLKF